MVEAANQSITIAVQDIQCRWHNKQGQQAQVLHQFRSANWYKSIQAMVLLNRFGRKQSNIGILLVCGHTTKDQLEMGMDRYISATNHSLSQ